MKLALNVSPAAERLRREGRIEVDLFKCPAWPELVHRVQSQWPAYVHFPLSVGLGRGDAIDTETRGPVDWGCVEAFLADTATRHVNVHLSPKSADLPKTSLDPSDPALVEEVTARLIKDLSAVVKRFGPDQVIAEGVYSHGGLFLPQATRPEVIHQVVEETNCGFLFDLSHSRMVARELGMPAKEYIARLPMDRVREMHVTGIQIFNDGYVSRLKQAHIGEDVIQRFAGKFLDHLPMTEADWESLDWAMDQFRRGAWAEPWVLTFEYGGTSSWWEVLTDAQVIETQIPRMLEWVRSLHPAGAGRGAEEPPSDP